MLFRGTLIALFLATFLVGRSQIVDDSSRLVYGPATTSIIYEADIKNNTGLTHSLDTVLTELENFTYYDQNRRYYQDLGNNGTAMHPVFFEMPQTIGKTSGFNAYDLYFKQPEEFKFYDTKSPFIDIQAAFGSQGRSTVDFSYSVNVKPHWNVGVDIHRVTSDKQIGTDLTQGDVNSRNTVYDIYTYYRHPEKPYQLLFNFTGMNHKVDETGGILVLSEDPLEFEFFQYRDSRIKLEDAVSEAAYSNFHLYHEYAVFKQFQLYHQVDRYRQSNDYSDFVDASVSSDFDSYRDFYDNFLIDADSTRESANFRSLSNEVGLKGTVSSVFYRFYVKRRDVDFAYRFLNPGKVAENYLGGLTRFSWKEFQVQGEAELLPTGEFKLVGSLDSPLLYASYSSSRYKPSYLSDSYFGNHYEWRNNFSQAFANEIKGGLKLSFGNLDFQPQAVISNLDDFYYFDRQREASQASGSALITRIGGHVNYKLFTSKEKGNAFHFNNEVFYNTNTGNASDLIRIPEFFFNSRYFWKGNIFQQSVPIEVGINAHGKSGYFANAYDPVNQQFYLQDDFKIDSFVAMDFFLNMRIDKVFAFFKVTHVNQPTNGGYFVTPDYPGQSRVLDFGVRWLFFD